MSSSSRSHISLPSDASFPYEFDPDVSDDPPSPDPGLVMLELDLDDELIDTPTTSPIISRIQEVARRLRTDNQALREEIDITNHNMGNVENANLQVYDHVSELASSNIQLSLRLEEARLEASKQAKTSSQLKICIFGMVVWFLACLVHKLGN